MYPQLPAKKEVCIKQDISWTVAPPPTSFCAFVNNLDSRINKLFVKFEYDKVGRTPSILDVKIIIIIINLRNNLEEDTK